MLFYYEKRINFTIRYTIHTKYYSPSPSIQIIQICPSPRPGIIKIDKKEHNDHPFELYIKYIVKKGGKK